MANLHTLSLALFCLAMCIIDRQAVSFSFFASTHTTHESDHNSHWQNNKPSSNFHTRFKNLIISLISLLWPALDLSTLVHSFRLIVFIQLSREPLREYGLFASPIILYRRRRLFFGYRALQPHSAVAAPPSSPFPPVPVLLSVFGRVYSHPWNQGTAHDKVTSGHHCL